MYLYFIEPDLHGRHGGLKGVSQRLLVPVLTNFQNITCVWGFVYILRHSHLYVQVSMDSRTTAMFPGIRFASVYVVCILVYLSEMAAMAATSHSPPFPALHAVARLGRPP